MKKKHLHFLLWTTLTYTLIGCSPKEPQFINTLEQENLKEDIESIILKTFDKQSNILTNSEVHKYSENGFIQEIESEYYKFEYDKYGRISFQLYDDETGGEKRYKITDYMSETENERFHYTDKGLIDYYISGKDTTKHFYDENNRLIKKIIKSGEIQIDDYIYNDNGEVDHIETEITDLNDDFLASYWSFSYNGYRYDKNNNWIERTVGQTYNPRTSSVVGKTYIERREIKYKINNEDIGGNENIPTEKNINSTQHKNSIVNIHTEAQSVFVVNQNNVRFQEVRNVKGDVGIGKNYNYWLTDKIRVPQGKRWTAKKALCVRNQNGSKLSTNVSLVHLIDGTSGGYRKEYDLTNERHNITLVGGDVFILKVFNTHAEYTISIDVEFEETDEY
ncbi:hypothetical protein [Dysgonomonas capnocytophagoides]|uniref:hypothetical protein n=1 Tax=Dysgonomonas capnocytophagoides TaxID=45254 RepID=UPI003994C103